MKLEVHIPKPPSVNGLYADKPGYRRGRIRSKGYKAWLAEAGLVLNPQTAGWETLTGPVKVSLMCDKGRADLSNLEKAPLDLLTKHRVYEDDSQIVNLQLFHDEQCGDLMFIHVEALL